MSSCAQCLGGTFAETSGASVCTLCPPGTFSAMFGASSCRNCELGRWSNASGANASEACRMCCEPHSACTTMQTGAQSREDCIRPDVQQTGFVCVSGHQCHVRYVSGNR